MTSSLLDINRLSDVSKNYFQNELNPNISSNRSETSSYIHNTGGVGESKPKSFIISKGADIFRQKLIDHFAPDSSRSLKPPTINASDISSNRENIDSIILTNSHEKIRFSKYSKINRLRLDEKKHIRAKKYYNRVQLTRQAVKRILNNEHIENILLTLLIFDAFVTGVSVNLSVREDKTQYQSIMAVLLGFQIAATILFLIESMCKLFIDYKMFFKSPWNVFDISLTLTTTILEVINFIFFYFIPNEKMTNDIVYRVISYLRVFRILRVLKIISHFLQLRIIIIALTKAFHSVMLISILLFIFAYIFASVGVVLFADMKSHVDDKFVNDCFDSINDSLLTLFAIMTLDGWWKIYTKASESNNDDYISTIYFISWILLASFIFQNLFTGAMVNNFQEIRENIERGINLKKLQNEKHASISKEQDIRLDFNDNERLLPHRRTSNVNMNLNDDQKNDDEIKLSENELKKKNLKDVLDFMKNNRENNKNWLNISNNNIDHIIERIKTTNQTTLWPEDTLLHYYGLMQSLMDNLSERMILLDYANQVLLMMHDRDNVMFPLSHYENAMKKNN